MHFLPLLYDNLERSSSRLSTAQERLVTTMVARAQRFISSIMLHKDPGGLTDGLAEIFRRSLSLFYALHRQRFRVFVDFSGAEGEYTE